MLEEGIESKAPWTPIKIIQWAVPFLSRKGLQNPRFDIEVLIAYALKIDRLKVYLQFDRPLEPNELSLIREIIRRRSAHEPIQYITEKREFFGLTFKVSSGVLIPRPETEQLVERVIEHLRGIPEDKRCVLDLGTGSGCVAISIAKNISCQMWAVEFSKTALEVAVENGQNSGMDKAIRWRGGDWFSALKPGDPAQFQVIVSNPPYIAISEKDELAREVRDYEPSEALIAGKTGLEAYEALAKELPEKLIRGGAALFEIHSDRYKQIAEIFRSSNWRETLYQDLQGLPRVLKLEK